jgi:hypothetical protein
MVGSLATEVVLLDGDGVTVNGSDPGNVAGGGVLGLSNGTDAGFAVDPEAGRASSLVPSAGVAPNDVAVARVELDAEALLEAPGNEAGALAGEASPLVDNVALVLVWVVVHEAGAAGGDVHRAGGGNGGEDAENDGGQLHSEGVVFFQRETLLIWEALASQKKKEE